MSMRQNSFCEMHTCRLVSWKSNVVWALPVYPGFEDEKSEG